jgi:hypothetical protein
MPSSSARSRANFLGSLLRPRFGQEPTHRRPARRRAAAALQPQGYRPVRTANGWTLPYRMRGGVKEFHLVAEEVEHEFAPGSKGQVLGTTARHPALPSRSSRATVSDCSWPGRPLVVDPQVARDRLGWHKTLAALPLLSARRGATAVLRPIQYQGQFMAPRAGNMPRFGAHTG